MERKEVDKEFKDYRNFGVALSLTLISISSALIFWGKTIILGEKPIVPQTKIVSGAMVLFGCLTIISCICIQFFNYQGYKEKARGALNGDTNPPASNVWFGRVDCAVYTSIGLFAITTVLATVSFFLAV